MNHKSRIFVFAVTTSVLVFLLLVMLFEAQLPARTIQAASPLVFENGESFIYLFSPATSTFVFTFSIPTHNAAPRDVGVVSKAGCQQVWFTEPGADRIGRLTYTSTTEYSFREYWVSFSVSDSQPLNLVVDQESVWFTEAGGNRIGQLDPATGQINEFEIPTPNSYPADLAIAADGSIWFTEMAVDQIGHLVVNSPSSYTFTEYSTLSLGGGRPYGIVAVGTSIYFAQTANDQVTRFTPPGQWVNIKGFTPGSPDEPYNLAIDKVGQVWGTERAGNRISQFKYTTFPIIVPYDLEPGGSMPTSLVIDENDYIWFTQWGAGQIGRLIPGSVPQKDYYRLPQMGAAPTGIATDNAGGLWVLALRPYRVYLPLISK